MSRRKRTVVLAGITTVCAVGALLAVLIDGGSARTAREPTMTYLTARRTLETHAARSRATQANAVKAYIAGIALTCGGVLRGAPPITGKRRFYVRKGSTLVLAPRAILFSDAAVGVKRAMQPAETAAISDFTREVKSLRWGDSVVTKLVHAFADVEDARLEQEAPELCRDARAWAASGYKVIAARTSRSAERLGAAQEVLMQALADGGCTGPYPGRAVLHVLERGTSRGERRTAEEISRSEARVARENAALVDNAVARLERELGTRLQLAPKVRPAGEVPACIVVPRNGPP